MAYPNEIRSKAAELRKKRYSLKELSDELCIAKATASLWSSNIALNKRATARLSTLKKQGQLTGAQSRRRLRKEFD